MSDEKHDECGIVAVHGDAAGVKIFYALRVIQHRGQEAAGIAVYNNGIKCVRGMGLVHEVFTVSNLQDLEGRMGIGHVRYSTTGTSCIENAQPVVVSSAVGDVALAHNGDIVNAPALREELRSKGWAFITTTDSEIIIRLLANELAKSKDVVIALRNIMKLLIGSYSLVVLAEGKVYGIRDPFGIKPLCIGRIGENLGIASESVVFDTLDAGEFVRDVQPGEIVEIGEGGIKPYVAFREKYKAHCMF
jgi:amidophosphoribosyltransferase